MIIVLGTVVIREGLVEEALRSSLEHVRRSREEPGCLSHAVHRDAEEDRRLVFVERWADRKALAAHFSVPESSAFVNALSALAESPPEMRIYDATELQS